MKDKIFPIVLAFVFLQFTGLVHGAIPASERAALIALYNSTHGYNWTNNSGWKTPPLHTDGFAMPGTEGGWYGVAVSLDHVNQLSLSYNDLSGYIPSQLGNLSGLTLLDLSFNILIGSIPSQLGNLSNLTMLNLERNGLSGSIPSELGNLNKLEYIKLYENELSGSIPPQLGNLSNLRHLNLGENQLTGSIPFQLGNLSKLEGLLLGSNRLSGSIPSQLGNLSNLTELWLYNNQLDGSIPSQLGNLNNLILLGLDSNYLSGSIPPELGNLNNLQDFYLRDNQLSGSIPSQLGNLSQLRRLDLYRNQLSDSIPSQLGNLSNLAILGLYKNKLNGIIPSSFTNLTKITSLDIGYNCLSATDITLRAWLDSHDSDWEVHQDECDVRPTVTTNYVSSLTQTGAICGGNVLADGGATVTARGVCWSTETNPSTQNSKTIDGTGTGSFTSAITGLTANKLYYVRAYATNKKGTAYGSSRSFTTPNIPTITTLSVSSITQISAICGGNVTADGGATVTARGVCWSIANNPTISNSKTTNGTGTGSFTSYITGLSSNTLYYVRAYATTSIGTAYGSTKSFTTASNLLEIDPPFGSFDSPIDGSAVSGSIAVTGWALDDGGLGSVKIYLTQGDTQTYIGDALLVEGARPDVTSTYPNYPGNTKAGWGYMLLTNFLPNEGNGTFVLSAIAADLVGKTTTLGSKTIIVDNAHAVKPFGAIDTPIQGGTVMGNYFVNWGWVLTAQPNSIATNGSTISVWVDSIYKGHPVYNIYRSDIDTLFPGYVNSTGASGYFNLDTTKYADGIHTIFWIATDNGGNSDGIGSRYFTIQNSSTDNAQDGTTSAIKMNLQQIAALPGDCSISITFSKGFNEDNECQELPMDVNSRLVIKELERVAIQLGENYTGIQGYLISNNKLSKLPIGSTLDAKNGTFSWFPGPGFLGRYCFVFVFTDTNGQSFKKFIEITIEPKFNGAQ